MERDPVPAEPEGDPAAEAEHLRPDEVPADVAEGWEESDATGGQAPTG